MASIKEIAAAAEVSIGTVDRVLHNRGRVKPETAERVRQIAKELGYVPDEIGKALAIKKKKLNIGFMIPSSEQAPSEFYEDVKKGAMTETENLKKYDITVIFYSILFDFETGEDVYPVLTEEEWSELDGLVTLGGNSEQLQFILDEAERRKIPVTLYNMKADQGKYLAVVQCDYEKAGRMAAGLAAFMTGEKGKVGILSMDSDKVSSYVGRCNGFIHEIHNFYPDMEIVFNEVLKSDNYTADHSNKVADLLGKSPQADLIYVINPGNYRIFDAIRNSNDGKKRYVLTNDLTSKQRELVLNGEISMTISQDPESQGKKALRLLGDYLIYGQKPDTRVCYTNLTVHFKQNI